MSWDLVVVGLGYVGLPLVDEACRAGMRVAGLDTNSEIVNALALGRSHVDDISDSDIDRMLSQGFHATTDSRILAEARNIVICVPTPLADGGPDLSAVLAAARLVAEHFAPGTLVVLESTTWPGTTDEVMRPILEQSGASVGVDFHLAYSPERIDPGNPDFKLRNTPKVVGGCTEECARRAEAFYSQIVDQVVLASGCREAEMTKLLENTYRHINIALVNEMAKFSHQLGIDFWDVIRCAGTKPFGYQAFFPGPGVGGHCIPIDPNYLSHHVRARLGYPFRFVELAQEINKSMPTYVGSRVAELLNDQMKPLRGSDVLLLGVTYKPGIADQRESPVKPLAEYLLDRGANVRFYDHFVAELELEETCLKRESDLKQALGDADVAVHLQPHAAYSASFLAGVDLPILDTRGTLKGANVVPL